MVDVCWCCELWCLVFVRDCSLLVVFVVCGCLCCCCVLVWLRLFVNGSLLMFVGVCLVSFRCLYIVVVCLLLFVVVVGCLR